MTKAVKTEFETMKNNQIDQNAPGRGMSAPQIAFGILGIITIMAFIVG